MGRLAGKVMVVTGAASGIGLACVARCVAEGARVVGADVAEPPVEGGVPRDPAVVRWARTDVTNEGQVEQLVARAVADFGRVDGVVTAAGGAGGGPRKSSSPSCGPSRTLLAAAPAAVHEKRTVILYVGRLRTASVVAIIR
jgi:NAD(P)-dependent dehydrogenase (short-subunit alcohol dehydrogenase family)